MSAVLTAPAERKPRSLKKDRRRALVWSYFFLCLFVVFFLTPPIYMFITSLKSSAEVGAVTNPWWVYHPTLENYKALIFSEDYQGFFLNSAMVSVIVVIVTMLISIPAAFALARMKFWGSATLAMGVFLTYLIPETLLFIPLFKIFAWVNETFDIQLINHWWVCAIIYPTLTVPFCTWIMIGYFASIPKELDEAARVDGAGWFRIYRSIVMPLSGPAVATVAILTFLPTWNQYLWPLMAVQSEELRPVMVGIDYFKQLNTSWGQIMAYATMITAPVLVLFVAFQRAFINSIASSGVKG